jgi:hypothetical protein
MPFIPAAASCGVLRLKINKSLTLLGINEGDRIPMIDAGKKGSAIILSAKGIMLKGIFAKNSDFADISDYSGGNIDIDLNERSLDSSSLEELVRAETEIATGHQEYPLNRTSGYTPRGYQQWGDRLIGNGCSITPFDSFSWKFDKVYDNSKDMNYQGDLFTYSHRGEKTRIFIASKESAKKLGYSS